MCMSHHSVAHMYMVQPWPRSARTCRTTTLGGEGGGLYRQGARSSTVCAALSIAPLMLVSSKVCIFLS